jgi:hypothetical protein
LAIRICPICFGKVPASAVVVQSDSIACPGCGKTLELSRPSRVLGALFGLAGAWLALRLTGGAHSGLGWVLPPVVSILAYAIASPIFLMLTGDLVVKREQPYPEPLAVPLAHGPAAHH